MSYRKLYEEKTNLKIPKGFQVHHIDLDRENNSILNLVALPSQLHNSLHKALLELPEKYITKEFQFVLFPQLWGQLESYKDIFIQVAIYIDLRNYLLYTNDVCDPEAGYLNPLKNWNYVNTKEYLTHLISNLNQINSHEIT